MSSDGPTHNEFDFEFLGNTTGEPYIVQTNVYVNGVGNREQRLDLWFDPTKEFHTYSILWNQRQVVWVTTCFCNFQGVWKNPMHKRTKWTYHNPGWFRVFPVGALGMVLNHKGP